MRWLRDKRPERQETQADLEREAVEELERARAASRQPAQEPPPANAPVRSRVLSDGAGGTRRRRSGRAT